MAVTEDTAGSTPVSQPPAIVESKAEPGSEADAIFAPLILAPVLMLLSSMLPLNSLRIALIGVLTSDASTVWPSDGKVVDTVPMALSCFLC